jgi:hypothetical protein
MEPFPSSAPLKSANPIDYAEPPKPLNFKPRPLEFTPTQNAAISPYSQAPSPTIQPPRAAPAPVQAPRPVPTGVGGGYTPPVPQGFRDAAKPFNSVGFQSPQAATQYADEAAARGFAAREAAKQAARQGTSNAANLAPKAASRAASKAASSAAGKVSLAIFGKLASRAIPYIGIALLAKDLYDLLNQPQAMPEGLTDPNGFDIPAGYTGGQLATLYKSFVRLRFLSNGAITPEFLLGNPKLGPISNVYGGKRPNDNTLYVIFETGDNPPNKVVYNSSGTDIFTREFYSVRFERNDGGADTGGDPIPKRIPWNDEVDTRPPNLIDKTPYSQPPIEEPKIDPSPQKNPLSPALPNINPSPDPAPISNPSPNPNTQPQSFTGTQTSTATNLRERERVLQHELAKQQEEQKNREQQKEEEKDRTKRKDDCCDFATISVKAFKSCGEDGKTPDYTLLSVTCIKSEEERIKQQFEQFYQVRASQCMCEVKEPVLVLPEYWQSRTGQRPQLVILYREILLDGKLGKGFYPLHLAHYNKPKGYKPSIPAYEKGNIMGIYTFADNSKLIVNAKTITEAKRVINSLLQFTDKKMAGELKLGEHGGLRYKEVRVRPVRIDFYKDGQKNSSPDWSQRID